MPRSIAVIVAIGLIAAACTPKSDEGAAASEPADAPKVAATQPAAPPTGFAGAINARGTEPFWSLEIRAGGLQLQRPDHPDVNVPNPGAQAHGDAIVWGAAGDPLRATLRQVACSDGMSDRQYPMSAEVQVGGETLKGCALPAQSEP
jgi:uncharacterized membrane protein